MAHVMKLRVEKDALTTQAGRTPDEKLKMPIRCPELLSRTLLNEGNESGDGFEASTNARYRRDWRRHRRVPEITGFGERWLGGMARRVSRVLKSATDNPVCCSSSEDKEESSVLMASWHAQRRRKPEGEDASRSACSIV